MATETRLFVHVFVWIFAFCATSCKKNERREEAVKIVSEWTGEEIVFNENLPCFVSGLEVFPGLCEDYFNKEFKILLYVDSTGCSSCRLKLFEWKQLIEEADSLFGDKMGFLFVLQPKNFQEVIYISIRAEFDYPILIDTKGAINRLNRFPKNELYQCFLLDGDNKVLSVGNPTINLKIWELYKSYIEGKHVTEPKIITTINAEKTTHDYGAIRKGSSNYADFEITNTGNNPLVISRISVACGCTRATWDKQPIAPGQATTIRVEMAPDETGPFSKTVTVYCNVHESPVRLTVKGLTSEIKTYRNKKNVNFQFIINRIERAVM